MKQLLLRDRGKHLKEYKIKLKQAEQQRAEAIKQQEAKAKEVEAIRKEARRKLIREVPSKDYLKQAWQMRQAELTRKQKEQLALARRTKLPEPPEYVEDIKGWNTVIGFASKLFDKESKLMEDIERFNMDVDSTRVLANIGHLVANTTNPLGKTLKTPSQGYNNAYTSWLGTDIGRNIETHIKDLYDDVGTSLKTQLKMIRDIDSAGDNEKKILKILNSNSIGKKY